MGIPTEVIINFSKTAIPEEEGKYIINSGADSGSVPTKKDTASPFAKLAQMPALIKEKAEETLEKLNDQLKEVEAQIRGLKDNKEDENDSSIQEKIKVALYAQLKSIKESIEQIKTIIKQVEDMIESIKDFFGSNFPVSYNSDDETKRKDPALDWEKRISAAIKEYSTFVMNKIMEIINAIIPTSLVVNIFGIELDLVKFFTDAEYNQAKKTEIGTKIDSLIELFPCFMRPFSESCKESKEVDPEKATESFFENFYNKAKEMMINFFTAMVDALVNMINSCSPCMQIISAIQNPFSSPDLTLPQLDIMIEDILKKVGDCSNWDEEIEGESCPYEYNNRLDALEALQIPLMNYLNVVEYWDVIKILGATDSTDARSMFGENISEETIYHRYIEIMHAFVADWKFFKYQAFLKSIISKIKQVASTIGLGSTVDALESNSNMSFSDFIKILGMPEKITIPLPATPALPA